MRLCNCLLPLAALTVSIASCLAADEPLSIGTRKQLFVDDYVIARKWSVTRELGQVTKANGGKPIMVPDQPWETDQFGFYGTVLHDGVQFRMWYHPWAFVVAYAESKDGIHWLKPSLGLYDLARARDDGFPDDASAPAGGVSNIIGLFGDGLTCFMDSHETDPEHRFKAAYGHPSKIMACLAHSPDGIHWTPYNAGEPVTGRASDTYNQLLWDQDAKLYRLFTRQDFGPGGGAAEVRGNRGMTNPDVRADPTNWTTVRSWQFDREGEDEWQRRQIYSLTDWIYEGVHFALMFVYEWPGDLSDGPHDLQKRHEHDVGNFYIATSRDGDNWDLSWVYAERPIIPRGPDGAFDKDMVLPASSIVTWNGRHWLYYCGYRERHNIEPRQPSIGLATLRLDGFVCLQAGEKQGMVITKPFTLEGRKLEVNLDASDGEGLVEVLDADGKPVPGFSRTAAEPLKGRDGVRLEPKWRGQADLSALEGQVVRLRFRLQNARLYAFQVAP